MLLDRRLSNRALDHFDWALFLGACLLGVFGVVNLYSATSVARGGLTEMYIQQIYWLVTGGLMATIVAAIDYRHYERLGYVLYVVGIILLILVFILGRDVRGSSRWIYIGSFSLQPSEFSKIFMIIALAKYFHDSAPDPHGRTLKDFAIPSVIAGIPMFLVLRQPDLGTALIHGLIFATICMMMRIRWRSLAMLTGTLAVATPAIWIWGLHDYQRDRITSFLNPEGDVRGTGYHAHHARIAIGNGGFSGQGFMKGTQNQYLFLPDQHSDFPFAVFAEDWGFLGCLALVLLYGFVVVWAIRIAAAAKDRFGAVIAIGVGALVFWHAVFNLGMVTGLLPVVGVTLPLFSAGGSSALTITLGMGLLMNVSMRRFSTSTPRATTAAAS
jgi:rod shape determining protein RodA